MKPCAPRSRSTLWLTLKVWGVSIVSFVFAIANMPMLLRHGLEPDDKASVAEQAPVE